MAGTLGEKRSVLEMLNLRCRVAGRPIAVHHRAQIDAALPADKEIAGLGAELVAGDRARLLLNIADASVRIAGRHGSVGAAEGTLTFPDLDIGGVGVGLVVGARRRVRGGVGVMTLIVRARVRSCFLFRIFPEFYFYNGYNMLG